MRADLSFPEPEVGGRGKKDEVSNLKEILGFTKVLVQHARVVLRSAPDLAAAVLAGAHSLDDARGSFPSRRKADEARKLPALVSFQWSRSKPYRWLAQCSAIRPPTRTR
jgi:hypothetical protein